MTVDEFEKALEAFCREHGYEIAGTCESEGIYGELTVNKIGNDNGWQRWRENVFNWGR